ncbi:hypothetical protein PMAC_001415 [Pneumocystis sp. 'macacae']|nr:hypothetical protein PMAC_001415 [Pneumocystis sp. 'macacae']
MKSRSPEFISQCRVLNFPWMERRTRRTSKLEVKATDEQLGYSRVLTFQPPPVEFTPATGDLTFPLIQMMNGKEPVVWEGESQAFQEGLKEATVTHDRSMAARTLSCSSQTSSSKSASKSRIPRPKNAFILYRSHVSQLLKETMAFKVRESNISSLVSEMWKKESDVVHAYYAKQAALEWVKYMKRLQQDRNVHSNEGSETKSSRSPVLSQTASSSLSIESQSNAIPYTQPAFSSPTSASISVSPEENQVMASYADPFLGTMLYSSSPEIGLGPTNIDTSTHLSLSPQSSNDDLFDPTYGALGQLDAPGYPFMEKMSPSMFYSFKDTTFSVPYDMNQLDVGYNCALTNPSTPVFSTNSYPYVVGTGLGLDNSIRWPGMMLTSATWPVNMT